MPKSGKWHYVDGNGKTVGSFTSQQICEKVRLGEISEMSFVWEKKLQKTWAAISTVPLLMRELAKLKVQNRPQAMSMPHPQATQALPARGQPQMPPQNEQPAPISVSLNNKAPSGPLARTHPNIPTAPPAFPDQREGAPPSGGQPHHINLSREGVPSPVGVSHGVPSFPHQPSPRKPAPAFSSPLQQPHPAPRKLSLNNPSPRKKMSLNLSISTALQDSSNPVRRRYRLQPSPGPGGLLQRGQALVGEPSEKKEDPMELLNQSNLRVRITLGPGQQQELPSDKKMEIWLLKWRIWKIYGAFPLSQHLCFKDKYLENTVTVGEVKPVIKNGDELELHRTKDNDEMLKSMHSMMKGYLSVMGQIKDNEENKETINKDIVELKEKSIDDLRNLSLDRIGGYFNKVVEMRQEQAKLHREFKKLEAKRSQLEEVFRAESTLAVLSEGIAVVDEKRNDYARARLDLERVIKEETRDLFHPLLKKMTEKLESFTEMNRIIFENVSKLLDFSLCINLSRDLEFKCLYIENVVETAYDTIEFDSLKRNVYGPLNEEFVWVFRQPEEGQPENRLCLLTGTEIRQEDAVPLLTWPQLGSRAHLSMRIDQQAMIVNSRTNFVDCVEKFHGARSDIFFCVEFEGDQGSASFQFAHCNAVLDVNAKNE